MYEELKVGDIISVKGEVFPGEEVFKLSDTKGLPLANILMYIMQYDMIIDWAGFVKEAEEHGWKEKTIVDKIKYACLDAGYGKRYLNKFRITSN